MEIIEKIKKLLEPIANERKFCIVDITYKREGGRVVLRILADKEGGITMDDCTRLNNELSELLDRENIIEEQYVLEVSSPGLDRKLNKDEDFAWAVGKKVKVTTYVPLDGKNMFTGTLVGLGKGTIVIEEKGTSWEIPREKLASARILIG
ncbi:MAG: ribosome maturation factor RimP [Candidatus Omnitrophota bacterium]|nr:MAG: ribosome maturation factor RimP [Candidatus Omnitrophota bacterium]